GGGGAGVGLGAGAMPGWVRGAVRALCLAALLGSLAAGGTELTLELPDSAQRCFHQELESGIKFTLDYQVLSCLYIPAALNALCLHPSPARAPHLCPVLVGDEPPILPNMNNRVTALTQMESACVTIHEMLNAVIDSQTHYRLREAQDRSRAEELHGRVSYWSLGETLILFVVSIGQVMLLKSFFTEKRPSSGGAGT
ncbi:TMED3 protein, partial [Spelaeornis formosus]|nr:TMED3 protein [Elachura formosa]